MKVQMPALKLPAIDRLINYPKNAIGTSQLSEAILTCSRVHLSQLGGEDTDDETFNKVARSIQCSKTGHIDDL